MKHECEFYILSGLGADHKVFSKLKLPENHHYIKWIAEQKNETLSSYATRLASQIKHNNIVLIGLSFGGIMAQEIAKVKKVKHIILLSSIQSPKDLAWYYRLAGKMGIAYILPNFILHTNTALMQYMFSMKNKDEKLLLDDILAQNSSSHFRWALNHIARWKHKESTCPILHLHGEGDRIFRTKYLRHPFEQIEGGHFMLYTNADEASTALKNAIDKIPDCTF
jgi:surfactin synthase thioesterase subunit